MRVPNTSRSREIDAEEAGLFVLRVAFGDRTGATVFLAALLFFALYWRVGVFSTDTYAVANTLVGVADGHLHVDRIVYGPKSGVTPGMHVENGRLYGRDYGLVFAALPILWLLEGLSAVADVRVALLAGWCLGVLGLALLVGERIGRRGTAATVGSAAALVLFVANAAVATPLPPRWYPLVALQLATMIAAAFTATVLYRLLKRMRGGRVGVFAGVVAFAASPVGFWAAFPKRHSATAMLAVLAVYCLYRGREAPSTSVRFRAIAYACVGLTAWIHAAEGLVLLAALLPVDLLTARSNRPRQLAVVGAVLLVSLLPFLLTNALIAGDPLEPPRLLPSYTGAEELVTGGADRATDAGAGTPADGSGATAGSDSPPTPGGDGTATGPSIPGIGAVVVGLGGLISTAVDRVGLLATYLSASVDDIVDAGRLVDVFVRGGYVEGLPAHNDRAINLAVLEAMPLAAALFATPVLAWRRFRRGSRFTGGKPSPARAADALAVVYLVLLAVLYFERIPTVHMLTVRYLHPVYPLGIYFVARTGFIGRTVESGWTPLFRSFGATVAVGGPSYVVALAATNAVLGEAVQLYALVALFVALVTGLWAIGAATGGGDGGSGAVVIGIAMGVVTVYLLVSGVGFFAFTDEFVLPMSRVAAESLRPINPLRSLH